MTQQNLDNTAKNNIIYDFLDKLMTSSVTYENYEELVPFDNYIVKHYTNNN